MSITTVCGNFCCYFASQLYCETRETICTSLKSTVEYDYPEEVGASNAFRANYFSFCWGKLDKRTWSRGGQTEGLKWAVTIGVHVSLQPWGSTVF